MFSPDKLLLLALEVSGYKSTSVAAMLVMGAGIILVWMWGKPWLQRKIQKAYGRKRWTVNTSNLAAVAVTLVILILPGLYNGPTRAQVDIQYSYIVRLGPAYDLLLLLVNVHNIGESPMVPENFQIRVLDGDSLRGPFDTAPFNGKWFMIYPPDFPGDKTLAISSEEFIEKRLTDKPVTPGIPVNGWLIFELKGVRDWRHAKFTLEFQDSFGKNERVTLGVPEKIPPLPEDTKMYRGVTYPFKEKNVLPSPSTK